MPTTLCLEMVPFPDSLRTPELLKRKMAGETRQALWSRPWGWVVEAPLGIFLKLLLVGEAASQGMNHWHRVPPP